MESFGMTDQGNVRSNNEDKILLNRDFNYFLVADGMGGHEHGEVASEIAVRSISRYLQESILNAEETSLKKDDVLKEILQQAISKTNLEIVTYSRTISDKTRMGTTLSLILFKNCKAYIAHVGDSRIYKLRHTKLDKLTKDHTEVQYLIDTGAILEENAENHMLSNVLTQVLGVSEMVSPDLVVIPYETGDRFLLCSDGLFRVLDAEKVKEIMLDKSLPKDKCRKLIEDAIKNGAPDNVSVIVIETKKQWPFFFGCKK